MNKGTIRSKDLVMLLGDEKHGEKEIMSCIKNLLNVNLLRYRADLTITCHSRQVHYCDTAANSLAVLLGSKISWYNTPLGASLHTCLASSVFPVPEGPIL